MATKRKTINTFCEAYVLPSDNSELKSFAESYRIDMFEQIVSSIEYALHHNLPMVEVFQFKNSDFVITLSKHHFEEHLDHIFQYYIDNERYELCNRVDRLRNDLNKPITNETKKAEKRTTGRSTKRKRRTKGGQKPTDTSAE